MFKGNIIIIALIIGAILIVLLANLDIALSEGDIYLIETYDTSYLTKYAKEDSTGCISFVDALGKTRKICGSYTITKFK